LKNAIVGRREEGERKSYIKSNAEAVMAEGDRERALMGVLGQAKEEV
jgi:hypothetical protein